MYPSQQNATDQTANFFWLLVLLTIGVLVAWWLEESVIVSFIFFIRHYEIELVKGVIAGANFVGGLFGLPHIAASKLDYWQHFMAVADKKTVTFPQIGAISDSFGRWFRFPVMAVLVGLAAFMWFHNRASRFRHTYTMQSLKKCEVENWPQITPVVSLNLLKKDLNEGPWAMAKLPLDFCRENDLLKLVEDKDRHKEWRLKIGQTERLMVMQMGPLWKGVQALPIHVKALVVIFVARAERNHQIAHDLLAQIAASAAHGKLDFSGVSEQLEKCQNSKVIRWLEKRHAYIGTLMASMLGIARMDGVLATAEFLWLKPVDRRLWYMLNSVGRQTPVVEVAGLFAHWLAEKKLQRPLRAPMVQEAVSALEIAVKDILYVGDEEKWHTSHAA
ncbi:type IVB secretion system coupling complex protein DotM/IcmP [Candidiatus Paracoxiella cheracis]|uniref:type IVB secretion system coupling complex protein DotM/IcmP n=1 Tax=Candidiatus Paracoxiella cheracis TaxID=3405120 RepID=UPI003BF544E7